MKTRLLLIKVLISVMILFSITMTGCGQKNQSPEPKPQAMGAEEKGDKIPEQLTGIEANIEKIFTELKGPAAETGEGKNKKESQGGQESTKSESGGGEGKDSGDKKSGSEQGGSKGGGQEGSSGEEEKSKQEKQQGQAQQPPKQDPWSSITPIISNMHYQWNSYMPMAAQKGATQALMDNFSKALNSLTNTIIGKNSTNTLMAANYLYAYIPDFYSLYKTETSPEIKRIKYHTRNAMLNSWTGNWAQAEYDINALKSSWPIVKNTVSRDQQDNSNKFDYSLYELDKVIKEKNQPLIDIKGKVALSNVAAIEQGMKKGSSGAGGESGSSSGGSGGSQ